MTFSLSPFQEAPSRGFKTAKLHFCPVYDVKHPMGKRSFSIKDKTAWLIFITALLVRACYLFSIRDGLLFREVIGDANNFDFFAKTMAFNVQLPSSVLMMNLSAVYLGFLTVLYKLFGHQILLVKMIQIIAGSGTCVLLYQTGKLIWNPAVGRLAGFLAVIHGIFIFYDAEINKACLVNLFFTGSLYFLARFYRFQKPGNALIAGFFIAIASQMRNNLFLTALAILIWICIVFILKPEYRKTLRHGLFFFLIALAAGLSAAYVLQTQINLKHGITSFPEAGVHFYIGNHERANGAYVKAPGIGNTPRGHTLDSKRIAEKELGRPLSGWETNLFWIKRTITLIRSDFPRWLSLEAKKMKLILNRYEVPQDENYDYTRRESWLLQAPFILSYGWLAPLALLGLIMILFKVPNALESLLLMTAGSYILSLLLIFVTAPYRLPLHIPFLLFAAYSLKQCADWILSLSWKTSRSRSWIPLILSLFLGGLFFSLSRLPIPFVNPAGFDKKMKMRLEQKQKTLENTKIMIEKKRKTLEAEFKKKAAAKTASEV